MRSLYILWHLSSRIAGKLWIHIQYGHIHSSHIPCLVSGIRAQGQSSYGSPRVNIVNALIRGPITRCVKICGYHAFILNDIVESL